MVLGKKSSVIKSLRRKPGVKIQSFCNLFNNFEFLLSENIWKNADVVLLGNHSTETTTIAEIQLIREHSPLPIIAMVEKNYPPEFIIKAAKSGVNGLVVDNAPAEEILNAIQIALSKKFYLCPLLRARLFVRLNQDGLMEKLHFPTKEQQILDYIIEGDSDKEIAFKLQISVNTVHIHKHRIYKKLAVSNRKEAADKYLLLKIMNGEFKGFNSENVTQDVT